MKYIGYEISTWSPQINHFAYTNDTILFGSRDKYSILQMMKAISGHEKVSGQKVHKDKSYFYVHDKSPLFITLRLRKLTGLRIGNFPFIYLGCLVFHGRRNSSFFEGMLSKIVILIRSWQNKFLTYGGKQILINNVLASIPMYMLSMMNPPKKILDQIHKIFASSFGIRWLKEANIGLSGRTFVTHIVKVVLTLNLSMIQLRLFC